MRDSSHSTASIEKPAIVAASGCAPPMPPRPAVRIQRPRAIAVEVRARAGAERLVRALHDALRADVDPRARRHLAVHHEALAVELVEVLPRRPVRHEVRVRDQHARRVRVRPENADRLARLHEQRLVVLQPPQHGRGSCRTLPSCARPCRCRRRRRACPDARRPRDRGCFAASGTALRSASCRNSGTCRVARARRGGLRLSRAGSAFMGGAG